jgi:hypothetical protein
MSTTSRSETFKEMDMSLVILDYPSCVSDEVEAINDKRHQKGCAAATLKMYNP